MLMYTDRQNSFNIHHKQIQLLKLLSLEKQESLDVHRENS